MSDGRTAHYVLAMERIQLVFDLTALRQKMEEQGYTIYHLARDMGRLNLKARLLLEPHFEALSTGKTLRELLGWWQCRQIEAQVAHIRSLENGGAEWTFANLQGYAHAVGQVVLTTLTPEQGEHSIAARRLAIERTVRQR